MSEKLLRGHGEPYLPVIIVDRLTVVPCTADGKNHCTWGVGRGGDIRNVGSRALFYVCRVCYTAVDERNHANDKSSVISSIFR